MVIYKASKVFRAAERSTESSPLLFGVETVLWSTKAGRVGSGTGGRWTIFYGEVIQVRGR